MSVRIPDGTLTVQIEETQLAAARSVARMQRMSEDTAALIKRVNEIETTLARISARLDAAEAVAEIFADEPIPFMPAQLVEAA